MEEGKEEGKGKEGEEGEFIQPKFNSFTYRLRSAAPNVQKKKFNVAKFPYDPVDFTKMEQPIKMQSEIEKVRDENVMPTLNLAHARFFKAKND